MVTKGCYGNQWLLWLPTFATVTVFIQACHMVSYHRTCFTVLVLDYSIKHCINMSLSLFSQTYEVSHCFFLCSFKHYMGSGL